MGEVGVVGGFPVAGDMDFIGDEAVPVVKIAFRAEVSDGGEEEGEAGGGSSGVLDGEETFVFGFEQVFEGGGDGEVVVGEVGDLVVEAYVAEVNGDGAVFGVEFVGVGDVCEEGGFVGGEDAFIEGAAEEGVVHAVKDVREGSIFGEDGFVGGGAGVAGEEDLDFGVVLLFKRGDHVFGGGEGVVGHDREGARAGGLASGEEEERKVEKEMRRRGEEEWFFHGDTLVIV